MKWESVSISTLFLYQDCFGYLNFRISFSTSAKKNAIGLLIRIALNLQITLGGVVILTALSLLIHELRLSFNLFKPLISFITVLYFYVISFFNWQRMSFSPMNIFLILNLSFPVCVCKCVRDGIASSWVWIRIVLYFFQVSLFQGEIFSHSSNWSSSLQLLRYFLSIVTQKRNS